MYLNLFRKCKMMHKSHLRASAGQTEENTLWECFRKIKHSLKAEEAVGMFEEPEAQTKGEPQTDRKFRSDHTDNGEYLRRFKALVLGDLLWCMSFADVSTRRITSCQSVSSKERSFSSATQRRSVGIGDGFKAAAHGSVSSAGLTGWETLRRVRTDVRVLDWTQV